MKKIFLLLLLILSVESISFAVHTTKVYMDKGGDRQVVASGGEISVLSGGEITLETGATLTIADGPVISGDVLLDSTGTPTTVPLTIKADPSQSANMLTITDSDDNATFQVRAAGSMINDGGLITTSAQYGSGLFVFPYGGDTPVWEDGVGIYDHTGGTQERLFTKSAGEDFEAGDIGRWILLLGANVGALAEIKVYLSATEVIVDGMGWDGDIASQRFFVYEHPSYISGDGNNHEYSVGATGEFEVVSYDFTEAKMVEVELDSAADNQRALVTEVEAHGYNNIVGHEIIVETGDLSPSESVAGLFVRSDMSEATSADASTTVPCYIAGTTDDSDAESKGYLVLAGMDTAFQVYGAVDNDPGYGYEVASGVVTDRVNGGTADTTAFLEVSASDLQIFDSDNDYILIGSSATFEIINVVLDTGANRNCNLTFEYSTGDNTWSTLAVRVTTTGFKNTGSINFDAPTSPAWAVGETAESASDISSAYYVKITRKRNSLNTPPVEGHFHTRINKADGMEIKGSGAILPAFQGADPCGDTVRFPEGSFFYNTVDNYPCFCNEATTARTMDDSTDCY